MNCVLVTGLDGSGKSTLLAKLENVSSTSVNILRVPEIDTNKLVLDSELFKASVFINNINKQADEDALPQLKLVALFFSMLIFKDILEELEKGSASVIFCERHPLIDTRVYGYFYAQKLNPSGFPKEIAAQIELKYPEELKFLLRKLNLIEGIEGQLVPFIEFLYRQFVTEKKFGFSDLEQLFGVQMPNEIVYLKANADVLMSRLGHRQRKEAHESKAVFEKLLPVYDQVLIESLVKIRIVDANDFKNIDSVFEDLKKELFVQ